MSAEQTGELLAALRALLQESMLYWGLAWRVEVESLEPKLCLFGTSVSEAVPTLTIQALRDQPPMRWLLVTAQPDPVSGRKEHYCASILTLLRTVRHTLDPQFNSGKRLRMGVASLRV